MSVPNDIAAALGWMQDCGRLDTLLEGLVRPTPDRWLHTYESTLTQASQIEERIDPDDGYAFIGPWEPVGCAVDPRWQVQGEVVPTLVTLWRRPMRKVTT